MTLTSRAIAHQIERSSWIRRMFEIGIEVRAQRGAENVFDFTLGNPDVEPPAAVIEALREVVGENKPRSHGYMPNAGYPEVREQIARRLEGRTGLPFTEAEVMMTCGAAGAINATLRSVLDPGDEVIVLSPYFPEYRSYVDNFGGKTVEVETGSDFQPDVSRIAAAITSRTKALILNAPNNPTGAVYGEDVLREINRIVREPMIVISDEPYRPITFDGAHLPETLKYIDRSVLAWSWSKAMAVAGERIGYLAVSPRLPEKAQLMSAVIIANRILGYINAPAIWQWVVARVPEVSVDISQYQEKRDILCDALNAMGYEAPRSKGSYYVFPKTPIADDTAFVKLLLEEGILAVPGRGFGPGGEGHIRLSITIPKESLMRSLPGFERAFHKSRTL